MWGNISAVECRTLNFVCSRLFEKYALLLWHFFYLKISACQPRKFMWCVDENLTCNRVPRVTSGIKTYIVQTFSTLKWTGLDTSAFNAFNTCYIGVGRGLKRKSINFSDIQIQSLDTRLEQWMRSSLPLTVLPVSDVHLFSYLFTYSFNRSFAQSFIRLFICLSVYLKTFTG